MDAHKVDMFIMTNAKFFEGYQLAAIKDRLQTVDDSKWVMLQSLDLKDPGILLIVSVLIGSMGVDRFIIGDTGLGVAKLVTCGGFGIWWIVDMFLIMGLTREKNMEKLMQVLY